MEFTASISAFREHISKTGMKSFLKNNKLLKTSVPCVKCDATMYLNRGVRDNLIYRCGARGCRAKKHIRQNSIFGLAQLTPMQLLTVLVAWILKYPFSIIVSETGVSRTTVRKLMNAFREMLVVWLLENSTKIGGAGQIVEVDESAFGKRKYNRGRVTKTRWVVGGIDRESKKCFLKIVEKRDSNSLLQVILENVEPGTTVITDMWRGYNSLNRNGFLHKTVNHSLNFVCPGDRNVHTQTIESHWAKIKRDMRRRIGRMAVTTFETYLVEYVWRNAFLTKEEQFEDFFKAINYFFPQ